MHSQIGLKWIGYGFSFQLKMKTKAEFNASRHQRMERESI